MRGEIMYCVNCGVKLADTEQTCPLCNAVAVRPEFRQQECRPLYPSNKLPQPGSGNKAISGALLILYLIPLVVCFFADYQLNGEFEWFGYVAGALILGYIAFALPLWFRKPNPVVFVPCNFISTAAYLLYIDLATEGDWFLSFALPVVGILGVITCTVVTLLYYLRKGKLYIIGGAIMALGASMILIEFLMSITFSIGFMGWSVYPLTILVLFGGFLIYLAANRIAREMMERKLFF